MSKHKDYGGVLALETDGEYPLSGPLMVTEPEPIEEVLEQQVHPVQKDPPKPLFDQEKYHPV